MTAMTHNSTKTHLLVRAVRKQIKMSDIGFLKNEPHQTVFKIQKPKTQFPLFGIQTTDFGSLGCFLRRLIHDSPTNMMGSTVNFSSCTFFSALLMLSQFG